MAKRSIVTMAMSAYTKGKSSPRLLWALSLLPVPGDVAGNEHLMDVLLDAVNLTGLSIAQVLNQESTRRELRWLPVEYRGVVPNYKQFIRMLDRLDDGGVFERRLAKYEEELMYQHHQGKMSDIVESPDRELKKTEFGMRMRMTGMLMKRRKDKGEADVVDGVANQQNVLRGMSMDALNELEAMAKAKVAPGPVIDLEVEPEDG